MRRRQELLIFNHLSLLDCISCLAFSGETARAPMRLIEAVPGVIP